MGKHLQQVKVLTEWDSIEDRQLEVGGLYAISPKTFEVWGTNRLQQAKDQETGQFAQVISDISYKPITLFPVEEDGKKKKDSTITKNIEAIALEAGFDELAILKDKQGSNNIDKYLGIIALVFAAVLTVLFLF